MSLLAKCPQCGTTIAKGTACPNCYHGENVESPEQLSSVEEYQRRKAVHQRHYAIFMGSALGLGLTTLLLVVTLFMLTKGWLFASAVAGGSRPAPRTQLKDLPALPDEQDLEAIDPADREAMEQQIEAEIDAEIEGMAKELRQGMEEDADRKFRSKLIWLLIFVGLMATEGGLTYFVYKCRTWWPVELNCPNCSERLDELGGDPERCPACTARLR